MKKIVALAILPVAVLGLSGCSLVTDLMHSEAESEFDDLGAFADWPRADEAAWLPGDARQIHVRESSKGDPAILGFTSGSPLDPTECTETERLSGPAFTDDWAPEKVYIERVFACGDWAVMSTDDGWFAWTPSAPGEQAVAP